MTKRLCKFSGKYQLRLSSCAWKTFACCTLHLLGLFMLIGFMCYMTYFNPASHFMAMSVATKINFLGSENFKMLHISSSVPLHANHFDVPHDLLQHLCTSSPCPWPPRSTACGWRTWTCCTLHLLWIFMTIVFMCCMTYFNTASHFMSTSVATKINFLGVENFKKISWCWRSLE